MAGPTSSEYAKAREDRAGDSTGESLGIRTSLSGTLLTLIPVSFRHETRASLFSYQSSEIAKVNRSNFCQRALERAVLQHCRPVGQFADGGADGVLMRSRDMADGERRSAGRKPPAQEP